MVRAFVLGTMGHRIDPSWWFIELFLAPASVTKAMICVILSVERYI